jgi:hypothetical protein
VLGLFLAVGLFNVHRRVAPDILDGIKRGNGTLKEIFVGRIFPCRRLRGVSAGQSRL